MHPEVRRSNLNMLDVVKLISLKFTVTENLLINNKQVDQYWSEVCSYI